MKDTSYVWGAAALVILIGIYTHTPYIKNFIRKINSQGKGFYDDYDYNYDYESPDSPYSLYKRNLGPSPDLNGYDPPVQEKYPSHIIDEYQPPPPHTLPVSHPNQHLCTGECKSGTCDSQGFCIDSGCGSVIRGESQCEEEKKKKKKGKTHITEKSHRNTIPRYNGVLPDIVIPALNPDYDQGQQPTSGRGPMPSGAHLFDLNKPSGASKSGSYRMNGDSRHISPNQSYGIYANVTTGSGGGGYSPGLEITSGGPGSAEGNCCGITIGIHAKEGSSENGKPFIATEDWTLPGKDHQGKHTYLCGGHQPGQPKVGPCQNTSGMDTINVRSTTVPMSWHCDQKTKPGHVIYCGRLDNQKGCGPGYFAAYTDPMKNGQRILPNGPATTARSSANDPSRVRADDLGHPDFGKPYAIAE